MGLFNSDNAKTILKTVKEVYDEHIIIRTRFDALEKSTEKALAEYKRLNERLIEKIEQQEKARATSDAAMLAKIASLEARLDAFGEKAMRFAVTDLAEKYLRDRFGGGTIALSDGHRDPSNQKDDDSTIPNTASPKLIDHK